MKIFRVVGFGLAIIIIRYLMPDLFHAIENTLLVFFDTLQSVLSVSKNNLTGTTYMYPNSNSIQNLLPVNW
ncbi:MAG: hypothetical protein PHN69_00330 [Candidatus Pacebacteria bacterium]|nr:hypothetical protein [Candidatus Paceibacterota bacterium]